MDRWAKTWRSSGVLALGTFREVPKEEELASVPLLGGSLVLRPVWWRQSIASREAEQWWAAMLLIPCMFTLCLLQHCSQAEQSIRLANIEQALGVGDGQGSLARCSPWGCKESDTTEWLNWIDWQWKLVVQFCPTLYDPMDCGSPCSSVHGIFQAGWPKSSVVFFP